MGYFHPHTSIVDYVADLNRDLLYFDKMREEFDATMSYVDTVFPYGFRKGPADERVPRVRFEALAVGVKLARRSGKLDPDLDLRWLESPDSVGLTRTEASNSRIRSASRSEFVRDRFTLPG